MSPHVLLNPTRPPIDDTFMEAPMPDTRFEREYLPLDHQEPGPGLGQGRITLYVACGLCLWAFIWWVL